MTPLHLANLASHVGAGMTGLAIGLVPMLTAQGGVRHRRWGRRFAIFAAVVVATAILADLFGSPPAALAAVTLSAAYQLIGSERALALRGRVPTAWDALLALAAIGIATTLLITMGPGTPSFSPAIGYPTLGYVIAIAVYDLSRHFWASAWMRTVRPLDHGLKMIGVYFAMASAGAGNLLASLQPWSQVVPSMLGMIVMLVSATVYIRRRRRTGIELG